MACLLSVIVPIFNGERFLEACLNSLKSQRYPDMEILMVDDGSVDKSPEICKRFAVSDSRFVYLQKENGGVSSARNLGLEKAAGEWIAFLDADDRVEPELYARLAGMLEEGADLAVCGFYSGKEPPSGRQGCGEDTVNLSGEEALRKLFTDYGFQMAVWNKLYRREILEAGGILFDGDLTHGEDGVFLCRYLCRCRLVAWTKEPLYYYRLTEESAMRSGVGFNPKRLNVLEADRRMIKTVERAVSGTGALRAARAHGVSVAAGLMAAAMDGDYRERAAILALRTRIRTYLPDFWREKTYSVSERLYALLAGISPAWFRAVRKLLMRKR
ncbi:MAG: glycosyltransferase [Lachnospiraceae bacterium]|nr:glycosyltransferase [Lachnospiraceae bacterium]